MPENGNVIVVGASAGGVEALRQFVARLPQDLPATVLVVLHMPAYGTSVLPAILNRAGNLPARVPVSGEPLQPGEILVARPDHHLVVRDSRVLVTRGPNENGHRPAIDVLFRTAAHAAGSRVVAVMLSGTLDDGTAGSIAVKQRGGRVLVQDPADALFPAMPQSVIEHVVPDAVAPAGELAAILADLTKADASEDPVEPPPSPLMSMEAGMAALNDAAMNEPDRPGVAAGYSCPDCGGSLFQIEDGGLLRFRCRVGHAWSASALFGEQSTQLDNALWMALRSLEEKAALARELGERAEQRGNPLTRDRYFIQADEAQGAASLVRGVLEAGARLTVPTEDENVG